MGVGSFRENVLEDRADYTKFVRRLEVGSVEFLFIYHTLLIPSVMGILILCILPNAHENTHVEQRAAI